MTKIPKLVVPKPFGPSSYIHKPIYIWNQRHQGHILRMSIRLHPFLCSCQAKKKKKKKKKAKNDTLAEQTLGTMDLKLGMYTQLYSGSNMGRVSPGHTSPFMHVRLKSVCMYVFVCIHFITKAPYQIKHYTHYKRFCTSLKKHPVPNIFLHPH